MSRRLKRIIQVSAVALLAVAAAVVVRAVLHNVFNETIPYTPFYPAIVVSTMYGRLTGGVIATVMAAFAASFWLPPFGHPLIQEPTDLVGLAMFLMVSIVVVRLCEGMRRAQQSAEGAARLERIAVAREHTARVDAEEASRLKDQFLAAVSHELRTPLQAILGWTQVLQSTTGHDGHVREALETVERNARLQSRLIEDLLDMSRIMAGKLRIAPRGVDLRRVLDAAIQSVQMAAHAKQISIVRRYDFNQPAWVDPDRFQQIIWNLLSNAIKFSPSGSTITIAMRRTRRELQIEVTDEGEGIDPEFLPYVFDRFRQAGGGATKRTGGLGLGLSIVKQLVELHGGKIQAVSAGLGHGTRITISLPVVDSIVASSPKEASQGQDRELQGLRVLVVDDEIATCQLIARILESHHSEVVAVTSVPEALDAMGEFAPDVIISDIAMPEADGYELLRQVRMREAAVKSHVPAIALTALSSSDDQRRAYEAGYQLHLTKPVECNVLTGAVAELAVR